MKSTLSNDRSIGHVILQSLLLMIAILSSTMAKLSIVGGQKQLQNTFTVGLRTNRSSLSICGGALIEQNWVLTAAHCIKENDLHFAAINTLLASGYEYQEAGQAFYLPFREVFIHPQYNFRTFQFDLALIHLDWRNEVIMHLEPKVQPIRIASTSVIEQLTRKNITTGMAFSFIIRTDINKIVIHIATIHGWGTTNRSENRQSNILRQVDLQIVRNSKCEQYMKKEFPRHRKVIFDSMICAGGELNKDACNNDSGGPLTIVVSNKQYLIGIVSWGKGCGGINIPGVYARISVGFISNHTNITVSEIF